MFSESLKGGLKAFVAVEQLLEGQRVAEPQQPLEIPCTHIELWTGGPLLRDREALTPDTPLPGFVLETSRMDPRGVGRRSLPDNLPVNLELLDERRFGNGMVYLYYRTTT